MAYLSLPTRRRFMMTALGAGAMLGAKTPAAARWALLSDTHVPEDPANNYRGFFPCKNMRQVAPRVMRGAPDGVLLDGDAARLQGLPGDYRNLKQFLDPLARKLPVAVTLGNHDHRENFLAAFTANRGSHPEIKNKFVSLIETGPVRFILLDSLMRTNFVPGLLGKAQRTWLEQYLTSAAAMPTLLFVHHTLDDGDGSLLDVERMFRIIKPRRMVKAVVYGHSHRYRFDTWEGIHLVNLPAVGYNFKDSEPVGWVEATLTAGGADFQLHAIGGNTAGDGKTTSIAWRS